MFFTSEQTFVAETSYLCGDDKTILLVMEGYSTHISYQNLTYLCTSYFIVAGLLAHSSHVVEPLDVGIFVSLKEYFRRLIS